METTRQCWGCCRWRRDRLTEATRDKPCTSLYFALCHPPPCSIKSGLQLQLVYLQLGHDISEQTRASLCTRESDACERVKSPFSGMELNFSHHQAALHPFSPPFWRNCPLLVLMSQPQTCLFCSVGQKGPPDDQRMVNCIDPDSSLSWLQSSTHLEPSTTCTFDLAVHSS